MWQLQRFKGFCKDIWSVPSFRYEKHSIYSELIDLDHFDETLAGDEENIINKKPFVGGSQVSGVPATSTITRQTYGVAHKVKS